VIQIIREQNKKASASIIFILILFTLNSFIFVQSSQDYTLDFISKVLSQPIIISSDEQFAPFPGEGTKDNPYRIENYTITTNNAYGIHIKGTTKHFVIQNCIIKAARSRSGIFLSFVAKGTANIRNNTITQSSNGIRVFYSEACTISNNVIHNNFESGILLTSSDFCFVTNNTIESNGGNGIFLDISHNVNIVENTIISNKDFGIYSVYSYDLTYYKNYFISDGIFFYEQEIDIYKTYNIEKNTVNGQELGFYVNLYETELSQNFGQLLLINCSSLSINGINQSQTDVALYLYNCTDCVISSSNFTLNEHNAILIFQGSSIKIVQNVIKRNVNTGISVYASNGVEIANNYLFRNYYGMFLRYSSDCLIVNNTFEKNINYGLILGEETSSNFIYYNSFIDNNFLGISQAYDSGTNYWYNTENSVGNYWSDYTGEGKYSIDGPAHAYDPFPVGKVESTKTKEVNFTSLSVFLVAVIFCFLLTRKYSKKYP